MILASLTIRVLGILQWLIIIRALCSWILIILSFVFGAWPVGVVLTLLRVLPLNSSSGRTSNSSSTQYTNEQIPRYQQPQENSAAARPAAQQPEAVIFNVGDSVAIRYAEGEGTILTADSAERTAAPVQPVQPQEPAESDAAA